MGDGKIIKRYDRAVVNDVLQGEDGYLTIKIGVTRPGVFPYRRQDGTIQHELKHPDDIFSDLTIQSANAKPITDNHPGEPVTRSNIKNLIKGMSHTDSRVQSGMIVVSETVFDEKLIEEILEGKKREVSIGFDTKLVAEKGNYNGMEYDFRQTDIAINHIAHVEQGRAGPEVGVRADDAWQVIDDSADSTGTQSQENKEPENKEPDKGGDERMLKFTIDGKEYEVAPEVKAQLETLQAKADTADEVKNDRDRIKGEVDTLQGKLDAKDVEIKNLEEDLEKAKETQLTEDAIDAAVKERLVLVDTARKYVKDFDDTGKDNQAVKVAVIQELDEDFKADGKSDEYINARYDGALVVLSKMETKSVGDKSLKTFGADSKDSKADESRKARLNMRKK